jgi:hypothetical protein
MELYQWAADTAAQAYFGDPRLNQRFATILGHLAAAPGKSIPHACGSSAATKACYRFFASAKITPSNITMAHQKTTIERIAEHTRILLLQDTSSIDLSDKPATTGLGYLHAKSRRGIMIHTALAVTPAAEVLGVLDQQAWVRPLEEFGKRHKRKHTPIRNKESRQWLDVQHRAIAAVPSTVQVISVADREADFYEFFAAPRPSHAEVLLRVSRNRRLSGEISHLHEVIATMPQAGVHRVEIGRANERRPRQAELSIGYQQVRIVAPPKRRADDGGSSNQTGDAPGWIDLTVVVAREIGGEQREAKEGAIEWILLTSLAIDGVASAIECVELYSRRWLIERFHYTLKSGCAIEQLQLQSAERLEKALAVLSIVACRLLWLLYRSRATPERSALEVLQPEELQVLYLHHRKPRPSRPPTLQEAVLLIAKMGGFLGRRGDGDPGIKTLWRGLRQLHEMANIWREAQKQNLLVGNA